MASYDSYNEQYRLHFKERSEKEKYGKYDLPADDVDDYKAEAPVGELDHHLMTAQPDYGVGAGIVLGGGPTGPTIIDGGTHTIRWSTPKIALKQIDNELINRLEALEKKVFGEYQAQKIKNKTDGSKDFENDVALFFQHDLDKKEWQSVFRDLNISIDKEDLIKLVKSFSPPKKKI